MKLELRVSQWLMIKQLQEESVQSVSDKDSKKQALSNKLIHQSLLMECT